LNRWYPEALREFKIVTIFDLLLDYLDGGRIQLDRSVHAVAAAYHDPCNYGRKSLKAFGQDYFEEGRAVTRACCDNIKELNPHRNSAYCCGAGGGAWAMPFLDERVYHGRLKARQIAESGAELIIAPCHTCHDQIKKSLVHEYNLDVDVKSLVQLVADALIPDTRGNYEMEGI
jgi:Fe-S oxidoreductase